MSITFLHDRSDDQLLAAMQRQRYSRQVLMPEVGEKGQDALGRSRVLIVGAGGLGSPVALYLAAAGIGTLILVDSDIVELSNLQRQVLHTTSSLGQQKTESAAERLSALNPHVVIQTHAARFAAQNADELVAGCDIAIDCTDNFETRYLLNDVCLRLKKPWIYGAVSRFEGQVGVFSGGGQPCYRCLFPDVPASAPHGAELGIIGTTPGMIGVLQAMECMKMILQIGKPLVGRLLAVDLLQINFRLIDIPKDPQCPACS